MFNRAFKKLYNDLKVRVEEEGKKNASWLMGYAQGLGNRKLTGYQWAALVDLLLVHPDAPVPTETPDVAPSEQSNKTTLAQR